MVASITIIVMTLNQSRRKTQSKIARNPEAGSGPCEFYCFKKQILSLLSDSSVHKMFLNYLKATNENFPEMRSHTNLD